MSGCVDEGVEEEDWDMACDVVGSRKSGSSSSGIPG